MRRFKRFLPLLTCLGLLSGLALAEASQGSAEASSTRLTFTKTFKGSLPEYMRVSVRETGEAVFQGSRQGEEVSDPESFQLSPGVTTRLFALAAELKFFRGVDLEGPKNVAHMGKKTFVYEKDGQRAEVSYNYTKNVAAEELQQRFENIGRGRFLLHQLEFRLRFDRLGILETLREFEREFNAGRLVDWDQFVPVLERIAADGRLMQLARTRAQALRRRMQGASARLQYEYGNQRSGWYYKVVMEEQGEIAYESRRFGQPANPRPLAIPDGVRRRLWELVRLANYFRNQTAAGRPAGQLAGYRLTYESGADHNQVGFSTPPTAPLAEMVHIFAQVFRQEQFRQRLQAAMEKGGVELQVVLQELEAAIVEGALVAPQEFEPLLREIANNATHHALTREKARSLLARL